MRPHSIEVKHFKRKFDYSKQIKWDDVIDKISQEQNVGTCRIIKDELSAPTFVLHNSYMPGSIQKVFDKTKKLWKTNNLHIYTSFTANSKTLGMHSDIMDVLIVQAVGKMMYQLEGHPSIILEPGDGILIPATVYHNPITLGPRITLSFSWDRR